MPAPFKEYFLSNLKLAAFVFGTLAVVLGTGSGLIWLAFRSNNDWIIATVSLAVTIVWIALLLALCDREVDVAWESRHKNR